MSDWWNVISSLTRVHAWAQILSVVFLALSASTFFLTLKTSSRIAVLKAREPEPIVAQAQVPAPKPVAKPAAKPEPATPVAAKPAPAAPAVQAPARPAAEDAAQHHLPPALKARLIALLQERPKGQVNISSMKGDPDSLAYSTELASVLTAGGWSTVRMGPMAEFPGSAGLFFMIKSAGSEPENTKYIIHSFIEAGLRPSTVLNKALQENTLLLVVGHR